MLASDLMKHDVERCIDMFSVTTAAIAMRDRNIGFMPVCTSDGVAVGTLTDRDITLRVLAEQRAPDETLVRDVMSGEIVSCRPGDELDVAEDKMTRFQKSRILCLDDAGRVVGVISLSTIAKAEPQPHAGATAASIASREATGPAEVIEPRKARCRDVMTKVVQSCGRTLRVVEIAALMRDHNIGFVPVCDETGAVVGTLTDRDLTIRVVADRRSPATTTAEQIMTPEIIFCSPDDSLIVAEDLMAQYRKSRVVCADADRKPLGVISLSDLSRVERSARIIRVLRAVSTRAPGETAESGFEARR
jgi:CBS domain-containing protein